MSKTINGLIGFVAGAAAGIITGLLIAPRKGEETRQLIKDKAKKVSTNLSDEFEEKIDMIKDKFESYKAKAEGKIEDEVKEAKEALDAAIKKAEKDISSKKK